MNSLQMSQIFSTRVQHANKNWTQSDLFMKMRGSNRFKINKKGVIWIENQGENLYKMLKICQYILVKY